MFVEGIGLFGWGWDALVIVGEDGFVSIRCVGESVVECFDTAPYLGWIGPKVYFVQ